MSMLADYYQPGPRIKTILVVIGTPVWASSPSSPVQAFAAKYGNRIKEVALFCTMGGQGAEKAFRRLERMLGKGSIATLVLTDREIDSEGFAERVRRFSKDLLAKLAHTGS
ncbi:MAG: flavodoxin family protein [Burkholderiales bacterium]